MANDDLPLNVAKADETGIEAFAREDLTDRNLAAGDFRGRMRRAVRWAWQEIALVFLAALIAGAGAGTAQAIIARL